jgi:uncharacterized protein YxeA
MDNKIIALIIIVVLIVVGGVYVFATQNTAKTNSTLNTTNNTTQIIIHHNQTTHNNTQNNTTEVKISAKQAQENAIGAEKDLMGINATAGTPVLFKWTENNLHTWVWDVPLFDAATQKSLGALYVDAMNGEIIMNE